MRPTGYMLLGYTPRSRGRRPVKLPIPFRQMIPMKLRDEVSIKDLRQSRAWCTEEMAALLACLKQGDFADSVCSKEITAFKKCTDDYTAFQQRIDLQKEQGTVPLGSNVTLNQSQMNLFLARFKQPK